MSQNGNTALPTCRLCTVCMFLCINKICSPCGFLHVSCSVHASHKLHDANFKLHCAMLQAGGKHIYYCNCALHIVDTKEHNICALSIAYTVCTHHRIALCSMHVCFYMAGYLCYMYFCLFYLRYKCIQIHRDYCSYILF